MRILENLFGAVDQDDWYNERRLHISLGMLTPSEYEQAHYAALIPEPQPA